MDALHALVPICPGEVRAYLNLQLHQVTDSSALLPRGVGKATEISFRASEGWSEAGVADWLKEQGLSGGTLKSTANGWTWIPEAYVDAYPR